jgi:hypothetical protein
MMGMEESPVHPMASKARRLVNIGLRGTTLCTRFLFVFFLARYVTPASVGYYGLFTATVSYALYLVGLDFYTYNTRELLRVPREQHGRMIRDQAVLAAGLYALFLPLAWVLLPQTGWQAGLSLLVHSHPAARARQPGDLPHPGGAVRSDRRERAAVHPPELGPGHRGHHDLG